jgi:hypothetical protein
VKSRAALVLLVLVLACGLSWSGAGRAAPADDAAPAVFALIIGSNTSVDKDVQPLKYADDDAARYLDLFRLLGARTYLLTRLDENTRRLHPQAAAEALEPHRDVFERTMAQIGQDVAQARDRHLATVLYVLYAGHGSVENGEGYVTLEDARITGADLARDLGSVPATRIHVIVDACSSYFLAYGRGPGGERRPVHGFEEAPQLAADPRIGLLLSTSSARESHEWDAFQAGVFSHEIRSGLYGAADADGDGKVSYREIAAFVARANEAIPNEKYRPDVHVKAAALSETLLDLRRALGRRVDVDGAHAGHYWIEDERGVRIADFHNAEGQAVHLVRPPPTGRVYARRLDDDTEYTLPAGPRVVAIADLAEAPPRVASRGAAHEAFSLIFSLPFERSEVDTYTARPEKPPASPDALPTPAEGKDVATSRTLVRPQTTPEPGKRSGTRTVLGWTAIGVGAATLGAGAVLSVSAIDVSHGTTAAASQATVASRDARITAFNAGAVAGYAAGGALIASGVLALILPAAHHVQAAVLPQGGYVGATFGF